MALVLDDRENHDLGAAFLGFLDCAADCHVLDLYMKDGYIYNRFDD
jgi:hypothetical protein